VGVQPLFIPVTEIIILDILQQVLLHIQVVQVVQHHQADLEVVQLIPIQAGGDEVYQDKGFREVILQAVLHTVAEVAAALAEQAEQVAEIQLVPAELALLTVLPECL
jgi:hypothetical protein